MYYKMEFLSGTYKTLMWDWPIFYIWPIFLTLSFQWALMKAVLQLNKVLRISDNWEFNFNKTFTPLAARLREYCGRKREIFQEPE